LQGCKPTVCLFALQKRRKQPERYVPFALEFVEKWLLKNGLTKKYFGLI
jgi:hypothetical protein